MEKVKESRESRYEKLVNEKKNTYDIKYRSRNSKYDSSSKS